ncbi:hypothetical protein PPYR_03071 [Photinus pyralis]|uniref:Uncharacterized protein n=1 Tax=Photinus pyralis TaxID=7054 RepID=A0A5N4A1U9_PHOPY|nr:uncharacterized protein LOC116162005 [Photinus pyralis]KAB0791271.1 hypothetical protein PPYR_03071 [Photinus pyralis]
MHRFVLVFVFFASVHSQTDILGQLHICKRSDPKLNDCLKSSIKGALKILASGVPSLKIPSIDPIEVERWTIHASDVLPYEQYYENLNLTGYSDIEIEDVYTNVGDEYFSIHLMCSAPKLLVQGDYAYYLVRPTKGEDLSSQGTVEYKYDAHKFFVKFDGDIIKKGGVEYSEIIRTDFSMVRLRSFEMTFQTDHQRIGDKLGELVNGGTRKLATINMGEYEEMYAAAFQRIANAVFASNPSEKLLPK